MRVLVIQGDITEQRVDAIVNSANTSLFRGGGVDGAIHRAAGPELEREAREQYGSCPVGQVVVTSAYRLPARLVLHAVGPRYIDGQRGEPELLRNCYRSIFLNAQVHGVSSMALPAISTGVYGYPFEEAAQIAVTILREFLSKSGDLTFKELGFIVRTKDQAQTYLSLLES